MPNRTVDKNSDVNSNWIAETHWIASGPYVCETGWPNMKMNLTNDGWLGIAPVNKEIMLKSLDFWRLESGLIRENWVLVDLLDVFNQVGINVFERLNELIGICLTLFFVINSISLSERTSLSQHITFFVISWCTNKVE